MKLTDEAYAEEGEVFWDPADVTHVSTLVGERLVGFCGASLGGSRRASEDDVDCMTCIAGALR